MGPANHSSSSLYPSTCSARVTLPGVKTPADIALRVIETCKLPHHDKVVIPRSRKQLKYNHNMVLTLSTDKLEVVIKRKLTIHINENSNAFTFDTNF